MFGAPIRPEGKVTLFHSSPCMRVPECDEGWAWFAQTVSTPERLTVLVLEDSDNDRLLLQRAFAREGLVVPMHFVQDGGEAIDYLQRTGRFKDENAFPFPNLLLLDLNMPGPDGFSVLEWLHARLDLRLQMLIVVFSATESSITIKRANELGADICVDKRDGPGEITAMVKRLKRMVEKKHGA